MRLSLLAAFAVAILPATLHAQEPAKTGPETVVLPAARGDVTFEHGKHAKAFECKSCHHASKEAKPLPAGQENVKCSSCHTSPVTEPMTTNLKNAMHNTAEKTGTCFDCHTKQNAENGKKAPTECAQCHVKKEG